MKNHSGKRFGKAKSGIRNLGIAVAALSVIGSVQGEELNVTTAGVGVGTATPERPMHIVGPDATFRMDRSRFATTFMLVRTDTDGAIWKNFVVGTTATGLNEGQFVISDMGTAVSGAGVDRMKILNDGNAYFYQNVYGKDFIQTSSLRYKDNVEDLGEVSSLLERLRGVRFDWKDTAERQIGLIAEEVGVVFPEIVSKKDGEAEGVKYTSLVPVLIEGFKEQAEKIREIEGHYKKLAQAVSEKDRLLTEYREILESQKHTLAAYEMMMEKTQKHVTAPTDGLSGKGTLRTSYRGPSL